MTDSTIAYIPFYNYDTTPAPAPLPEADTTLFPLDSVLKSMGRGEPHLHKSLFTHHGFQVVNDDYIARPTPMFNAYPIIVILAAIALTYYFLHHYALRLSDAIRSAFNLRTMDRVLRETNLNHATSLWPVGLLLSFPLALVANYYTTTNGITLFLGNSITNLAFTYCIAYACFLVRTLAFRFIGAAFYNQKAMQLFISSNYIYHLLEVAFTLPLTMLLYYMNFGNGIVFIIILCILAVLCTVRIFRGAKIIITNANLSRMQLFYYLCIVEIVPLILLYEVFISL